MTARLSGIARQRDDVTLARSSHSIRSAWPYVLCLGDVVVLMHSDAFDGLAADVDAIRAMDDADTREAALPPIPDPPESLADRLTTEHLHDVAEGRQP